MLAEVTLVGMIIDGAGRVSPAMREETCSDMKHKRNMQGGNT